MKSADWQFNLKFILPGTYYTLFSVFCRFLYLSCSVPPADCQLCEQVSHGHSSAAAVPGHPRVYGAQQSGSLPQGGARDHHWTAHPPSSGVSGSVSCMYETISVSYTIINAFQTISIILIVCAIFQSQD